MTRCLFRELLTGDRDQDDLLVLKLLGGIVCDGIAADFGVGCGPRDVLEQDYGTERISFFLFLPLPLPVGESITTHRPLGSLRPL